MRTMTKDRDKAKPLRPLKPNQIRNLRESLKLSVADIAERFNVSPRTWYAWEAGDRTPDGMNLKMMYFLINPDKHPL